jgi:ABC-2 type transport system permease protein
LQWWLLPGHLHKSDKQANNLSIMMGMVLALLGGCWWPVELFPGFMQQLARLFPTSWAMQGFTDLVLRGYTAGQVLPSAAVLLGFAVLFFTVGVLRFRCE